MKPFRMLTAAASVAAILPRLSHRGMFVDGVTYASIARNLAQGHGHFWAPSYTATIYPEFHDHPPFGFWLQSLWFRVLGDRLFVERAYSAAAAVATAFLIALVWRRLHATVPSRRDEWLPIALWMAVPVVSWAIAGNLLETTVSVFTTASVAAALEAGAADSTAPAVGWGCLSGLCVVAAALTKGPVGLFPLAAPAIFAFGRVRPRWRIPLLAQWLTVAICALILFNLAEPRESLGRYVHQQVLAALGGRREISGSSLTILKALLQSVCLPMGLIAAVIVSAARHWTRVSATNRDIAIAFVLLGLAGTLPILASTKQAGHYLVPAVPFYAIGAASLISATMADLERRIITSRLERALNLAAITIVVAALAAAYFPTADRDRGRLADLDRIAPAVPRGVTIGICPEANGDWGLHAWFERRFLVSLDAAHPEAHEWFLQASAPRHDCPPASCRPTGDHGHDLVLFRCR